MIVFVLIVGAVYASGIGRQVPLTAYVVPPTPSPVPVISGAWLVTGTARVDPLPFKMHYDANGQPAYENCGMDNIGIGKQPCFRYAHGQTVVVTISMSIPTHCTLVNPNVPIPKTLKVLIPTEDGLRYRTIIMPMSFSLAVKLPNHYGDYGVVAYYPSNYPVLEDPRDPATWEAERSATYYCKEYPNRPLRGQVAVELWVAGAQDTGAISSNMWIEPKKPLYKMGEVVTVKAQFLCKGPCGGNNYATYTPYNPLLAYPGGPPKPPVDIGFSSATTSGGLNMTECGVQYPFCGGSIQLPMKYDSGAGDWGPLGASRLRTEADLGISLQGLDYSTRMHKIDEWFAMKSYSSFYDNANMFYSPPQDANGTLSFRIRLPYAPDPPESGLTHKYDWVYSGSYIIMTWFSAVAIPARTEMVLRCDATPPPPPSPLYDLLSLLSLSPLFDLYSDWQAGGWADQRIRAVNKWNAQYAYLKPTEYAPVGTCYVNVIDGQLNQYNPLWELLTGTMTDIPTEKINATLSQYAWWHHYPFGDPFSAAALAQLTSSSTAQSVTSTISNTQTYTATILGQTQTQTNIVQTSTVQPPIQQQITDFITRVVNWLRCRLFGQMCPAG